MGIGHVVISVDTTSREHWKREWDIRDARLRELRFASYLAYRESDGFDDDGQARLPRRRVPAHIASRLMARSRSTIERTSVWDASRPLTYSLCASGAITRPMGTCGRPTPPSVQISCRRVGRARAAANSVAMRRAHLTSLSAALRIGDVGARVLSTGRMDTSQGRKQACLDSCTAVGDVSRVRSRGLHHSFKRLV